MLSDYFDERGVRVVTRNGGQGSVTLSGLLTWIDAFEADEVYEAFEDQRDALRLADGALRALSRQLSAAVLGRPS